MRKWLSILFLLCLGCLALPASAQDSAELAKNNPVGIVALASGTCEIKKHDGDWQPAFWLTLLQPEDQLRTGDKGSKIVVNFFSDDHQEVMDASSEAKVSFKALAPAPGAKVRKEEARDRATAEIAIPYMLVRKLFKKEFALADEPGALEKEQIFLVATVRPESLNPVFQWKNTGPTNYKVQLFNEWNEVKWDQKVQGNQLKFPFKAPFRLASNSVYFWQVTAPDDTIVVRKYQFTVLTKLHADQLERMENKFNQLVATKKANQTHYTDMFLLYNNRRLTDRTLKLLKRMSEMDPENPIIYRALTRVFLDKGCPYHAREALNRETQLNGNDPVFE